MHSQIECMPYACLALVIVCEAAQECHISMTYMRPHQTIVSARSYKKCRALCALLTQAQEYVVSNQQHMILLWMCIILIIKSNVMISRITLQSGSACLMPYLTQRLAHGSTRLRPIYWVSAFKHILNRSAKNEKYMVTLAGLVKTFDRSWCGRDT